MFLFAYTAGIKYIYLFIFKHYNFLMFRLWLWDALVLVVSQNLFILVEKKNLLSKFNSKLYRLHFLKSDATVKFCFNFSLRRNINQKRMSL